MASQGPVAVGGSSRDVVEFTHPACAIVGLAFWMGYTLVHNRALAWIAFGLAAVTACAGLAWFLSNRKSTLFSPRLISLLPRQAAPPPSLFVPAGRLISADRAEASRRSRARLRSECAVEAAGTDGSRSGTAPSRRYGQTSR